MKLFHVSESPDIRVFDPRPSPSYFETIEGNVVFAISDRLLHNYLLPRDCPRVTFYANSKTTTTDKEKFFGQSTADFVVAVEESWYQKILQTRIYCYEMPTHGFSLLDETAGYYVSNASVKPLSMKIISNVAAELQGRKVDLHLLSNLHKLAEDVARSSLSFSIIRMRNSKADFLSWISLSH